MDLPTILFNICGILTNKVRSKGLGLNKIKDYFFTFIIISFWI